MVATPVSKQEARKKGSSSIQYRYTNLDTSFDNDKRYFPVLDE
jgi:hypothetical protein